MITAAVERCAGIDVGNKQLSVYLMVGPLEGNLTRAAAVLTIRGDLERWRDWLKQQRVTHVVMESTGSYGKPVFNVLEGSVRVYLANPQEVKNRRGRQTDDKEGWWLAHLLRHAMIHPSFIPPRPIRELRDLTRRRKRLLSAATSEKNRVQKVLEDANVSWAAFCRMCWASAGHSCWRSCCKAKRHHRRLRRWRNAERRRRFPRSSPRWKDIR